MHDPQPLPEGQFPVDDDDGAAPSSSWGWLEVFVLVQIFWAILLFLPGTQDYRMYIRAFPYLASLAALAACLRSSGADSMAPGARWIGGALVLLIVGLLHPATWMMAGIAQLVFQISIAAPIFWAARIWILPERLMTLVWLVFGASFAGAAVGLLQVYYPDRFLPPEFSALALKLNPHLLGALSYAGSDGRMIIRPPGLSDLPGGAAISGTIAALLAFAFAMRGGVSQWHRAAYLAAAVVGITVIYLTQVRSMVVMMVCCMLTIAAVRLRQGRVVESSAIATAIGVLVVGSFVWAVTVGGETVADRFTGLLDSGVMTSYQQNRGFFLEHTIRELIFEYPFGAGVGRWGMMSVYFDDPGKWQFPALHAEIQPTGWVYDGGVLMWVLYGGAILAALRNSYRVAVDRDDPLHELASMVLSIQVLITGLCFTGPVFNTQMGIVFWLLTALLFGAQRTEAVLSLEEEAETEGEDGAEEDFEHDPEPAVGVLR